jgi:hypothetical protein
MNYDEVSYTLKDLLEFFFKCMQTEILGLYVGMVSKSVDMG